MTTDTPRFNLGAIISGRRTALRMSQGDLAARVGVDRSAISQIESGRVQTPTPEVTNRLAAALGIPVNDLVEAMGFNIERDAAFIADRAEMERRAVARVMGILRDRLAGLGL